MFICKLIIHRKNKFTYGHQFPTHILSSAHPLDSEHFHCVENESGIKKFIVGNANRHSPTLINLDIKKTSTYIIGTCEILLRYELIKFFIVELIMCPWKFFPSTPRLSRTYLILFTSVIQHRFIALCNCSPKQLDL